MCVYIYIYIYILLYCHIAVYRRNIIYHHHNISVMQLGLLLTRSGLTYPQVSSNFYHDSFCQSDRSVSLPWVIYFYHDSFCQSDRSVSLPWVIYFEAFYPHVLSSFSCMPVIFPKSVLFLTPFANLSICSVICPKCILLFFSCISSLLLLLSWHPLL